jgi:ADP-ribose pyrophosphatase
MLRRKVIQNGHADSAASTDPGFTNTNLSMVEVSIDMSLPANQAANLKPELEDNEFIEVFSVPVKDLWSECRRLEKEGYAIDARVGTLAEGLQLAKRLGI